MSSAAGTFALPSANLPRISLVTPSFNQVEYLEATLRSVLDQGYPNLEYIVVDGGSTDGSLEILSRYAEQLSYWVSEPDRGHAHALNKGFSRSTGEVMGWINSDDLLLSGSLLLVGSLFAQFSEMEWLTSPGAITEPGGRIVATFPMTPWTRARFLFTRDHWIQQESTFWRSSLWQRAGARLDEDLLACDHELWARFFRHAQLFQTAALIGAFRFRPEQRSAHQRDRYVAEMLATIEREVALTPALHLGDDDGASISELCFDLGSMTFERTDRRLSPADTGPTIVSVDAALGAAISLSEVRLPPWGAESSPSIRDLLPVLAMRRRGSPIFLWLGCGEAEGIALHLRSAARQTVELRLVASPGPAREDRRRTLSFRLSSADGRQKREELAFEREELLSWRFELAPGRHDLTVSICEPATITPLPSGDSRPLLAVIADVHLVPAVPG